MLNWTYFPLHLTNFSMAAHWFFWTMVLSFWCFFRRLSSSFWCFLVSFTKLFSFFTTSGVIESNFISSEKKNKNVLEQEVHWTFLEHLSFVLFGAFFADYQALFDISGSVLQSSSLFYNIRNYKIKLYLLC